MSLSNAAHTTIAALQHSLHSYLYFRLYDEDTKRSRLFKYLAVPVTEGYSFVSQHMVDRIPQPLFDLLDGPVGALSFGFILYASYKVYGRVSTKDKWRVQATVIALVLMLPLLVAVDYPGLPHPLQAPRIEQIHSTNFVICHFVFGLPFIAAALYMASLLPQSESEKPKVTQKQS